MTIVDEILTHKRVEVDAAQKRISAAEMCAQADAMTAPTRGFLSALTSGEGPAIIAEIKRCSPSKGLIREDFEPAELAAAYQAGGASCLSVLTDAKFFGGELEYLAQASAASSLPLLRKDFVIDRYQIDEARVAGADAVLLIVSSLSAAQIVEFHARARALDLDVLVEVHDEAQLEIALECEARLIGVNNRDLRTFDVDLGTTERLAGRIPADADVVLVAESGISEAGDIERLQKSGAHAFLVGESLMRQADVAAALKELRQVTQT